MRLSIPTERVWAVPRLRSKEFGGQLNKMSRENTYTLTVTRFDLIEPAQCYRPCVREAVIEGKLVAREGKRLRDGEAQAIRPAARHFGATFSSMISTLVRKATSSADISRLIRARCGLFLAIFRASGGRPRFL